MKKKQIIVRGFWDALGVAAYVFLFVGLVVNSERWFGDAPDTWLAPVLMLILFIVSASVTGSLVLLKPVVLYVEGQKKESIYLFAYTIGFLAAFALIIALIVVGVR